ncbi:MAG: serine/threonine-protein kinase, partial [Aureliella sp.]
MPLDLEQTIAFDLTKLKPNIEDTIFAAESMDKSRVRVDSLEESNERLSIQFEESTRHLLRERLLMASGLLATLIATVQLVATMSGHLMSTSLLTRLAAFACLIGVVILLRKRPKLPLSQLRWLEILVVAAPITQVLFIQYLETERLIGIGKPYQVPTLMASVGAAVSLFIATYAMFIPANWYRTAVVAFTAAAFPTALTAVQFASDSGLKEIEYPGFATPFLLFATAIVATVAAHLVRTIRHEAESALLYGQYHLTEEIGRGGMGIVYRAEHRMLKRPAAIKLIRSECAADENAIARFESEVQLSATLSHWNTVQIYDYGRTERGDFYYVMEYLEGKTLAQRLSQMGPMDSNAAVNVIRQICNGLEEAHAKSMVHGDLKPANIFLSDCGSQCDLVKILDFGLATSQTQPDHNLSVHGSPPYMSPEQIRGEVVDGRSDIYSIGCVLYECLKGRPLFEGTS